MGDTLTYTLTYTGWLVIRRCWCGIRHAIPSELSDHLDRGGRAYCPLGHSYVQAEPTLEQRLAAAEARLVAEQDQHDATRRSLAATKGQVTRIKRRVHRGVCPHCTRTFADLVRHMETKHPEEIAAV